MGHLGLQLGGSDHALRGLRHIPTYNMGGFGASMDQVRVYSSLPNISTFQQILIGGSFT